MDALVASSDTSGDRTNYDFTGSRDKTRAVPSTSMWEMEGLIWALATSVTGGICYNPPVFAPPVQTGSDHISPWRESHPDLTPLFSVDRLDVLPLGGGTKSFMLWL